MGATRGLTANEVKALSVTEFFPLENVAAISSQHNLKGSAVATSLRRLKEKSYIKQQGVFNPFAVGLTPVAVFGQMLERRPEQKAQLLARMKASPYITYIFETLGQYNFYFSMMVPSIYQVACIMRELFEKQGDIFSGKLIAPRLELVLFPKKFLGVGCQTIPEIRVMPHDENPPLKLDKLDNAILHQLCNQGFDSFRQVAKSIGEPASTVERRVKRLQESRVLSGVRYVVDRRALNTQHARLLLSKKGFCSKTNDSIFAHCREHPNVVRVTRSIGAWDYEVSVEVETLADISCIVNGFHDLCGVRLAHVEVVTELEMHFMRPFVVGGTVGGNL